MVENNILISDLYEVKITTPKSQLKYGQSIPIYITIVDFNGNNIDGKNVTLTTDNGSFLRSGGQSLGQNVTFTNYNNDATIGFTMSNTGIANIVAKINNKVKNSLQIFTEEYRRITLNTANAKNTTYLYINEHTRVCILPYTSNKTSLQKGNSTNGYSKIMENGIIPIEYRPMGTVQSSTYRPDIAVYLQSDGSIYYRVEEDKNSLGADFSCTFNWSY